VAVAAHIDNDKWTAGIDGFHVEPAAKYTRDGVGLSVVVLQLEALRSVFDRVVQSSMPPFLLSP